MKQQKLTGYQPNYPKRILKGTVLTAAVLVGLGGALGCKQAFEPGPDIEGMISIATPEPEELVLSGEVAIPEPTDEPALQGKIMVTEPPEEELILDGDVMIDESAYNSDSEF